MKVNHLSRTTVDTSVLERSTQQQQLETTYSIETDLQNTPNLLQPGSKDSPGSPVAQQQVHHLGSDPGQLLQPRAAPGRSALAVHGAPFPAEAVGVPQLQSVGRSGTKRAAAAADARTCQMLCPTAVTAAMSGKTVAAVEVGSSRWLSNTDAAAKRQRLEPASLHRQSAAPAGQHLPQSVSCGTLQRPAAAIPAGSLWPGQVSGSFPVLTPATAACDIGVPFGNHALARHHLPAAAGVLPHHIPGITPSWPAARPVLGLPDNTIQVAAAAAAAAAATATRAAMGQDPSVGWTPAMAAAAMVAAAGAHEGAAVTAAAAAPHLRHHGHQTTQGRRQHQLAGRSEDISSRQGSLRVLGSGSVDGATKGMSAELSDAAQPPAAATAARDDLQVPLDCLGGGNIAGAPVATAAAAGGALQQQAQRHVGMPNRPVQSAGISQGPAAAQVLGAANRAVDTGVPLISIDRLDSSQLAPAAAAAEIAGSPSSDPCLRAVQQDLSGPAASPAATPGADYSGGQDGNRHDLTRRFEQEQQQQQRLCLAALGPTGTAAMQPKDAPLGGVGSATAPGPKGSGWPLSQQQFGQQGMASSQVPASRPPAQRVPLAAAAAQRSGSDPHSHSPSQQQQVPRSGHNATAGAIRPVPAPSGFTAAPPAAAAGAGVPVVTLPLPTLLPLSTAQHPSLPRHLAVQHDVAVGPAPTAAAAAPISNWMQGGQCWQPPWSTAAVSGSEHAGHHIAGPGAMRGMPITTAALNSVAAGGHVPPLLPGAPLHPVAAGHAAAPPQLLPVAPGLGHTTAARAPEPVTPAEASMTSAAAQLQQLQQHEPATQTPSGVTAADVSHPRDPAVYNPEHTLAEVSRQLLQQVQKQQQQQQQAVAVAAEADAQATSNTGAAAGSSAAAAAMYAKFTSGLGLSAPIAAAWVGAQQPVLDAKLPEQLVLAPGEAQSQQQLAGKRDRQQQQQQGDGSDEPGQLGNSGGSTGTEQQLTAGPGQVSQQQQQQQRGSGSNGSGSGQTSVAAVRKQPVAQPGTAALAPLPPAAAAAVAGKQDGSADAQAAAAAAIADANNAAVAMAAAAVAAAANVAAHAAAATGVSATAQCPGTHLLGFARMSGSGGIDGSGGNGLHGSNTLASTALQGSNGNGSNGNGSNGNGSNGNGSNGNGSNGHGSGGMTSGTAAIAGGGLDGSASGQNGSQSDPAQPPAGAAAAAAAAAVQQQLLQAIFADRLPASAAPNTAAAVPTSSPGVESLCQARVSSAAAHGCAQYPPVTLAATAAAEHQQQHPQPASAAVHASMEPLQQKQQQQQQQQPLHQHPTAVPNRQDSSWLLQNAIPVQPHAQQGSVGQQQQQLLASLAALAAAQGGHQQSALQQQQQQASWWQQQQLLLAQQACQWQNGLTQQAALLQHLPAAVAVMGLHGLAQHWPVSGMLGVQGCPQQLPQHGCLQQQQHAAAATAGLASCLQQQFAMGQLTPPTVQQPALLPVMAAAAAHHTVGEFAAVPVLHTGLLSADKLLAELNGSGAAALVTDAAGGAVGDTSAGGNGSGGTEGVTGGTAGTAGGTGHGSGGTGGAGGTYGTAGMYGSAGASWGVKGSNTAGLTGLTSGNAAAGSGLAAGQCDGAAPMPRGFAAGHHYGALHQYHAYSSHCAENTLDAAGLPASMSQQQQQPRQGHDHGHNVEQSAAAQHQQQQFLQQCQSLMQQKMLAGCQQQQQPCPNLSQQQPSPPVATAAATMRPMAVAGCSQAAPAAPATSANPALSGQALSIPSLLWLQQNAASAVQHYQDLQHVQQQQQQPSWQHGMAGPIENTAALNSWVPSMLPLQAAAGTVVQPNTALVDGGSGGADGSGGGTGGTGGGTGKGSNDPEGTAAAAAVASGGGTAALHPSLVASSSWMPSNLQQPHAWQPDSAAAAVPPVPLAAQQQQPLFGQPFAKPQVPPQLLQQCKASQLPSAMPSSGAAAAGVQPAAPATAPIGVSSHAFAAAAAAAAAGGGSSGGGSMMGLGSLLPPMSSDLAARSLPAMIRGLGAVAGGGSGFGLAGPPSLAAPLGLPMTSGLNMWPSSLAGLGLGFPAHDLYPAAALLQQITPSTAWADLGAQTAACFTAGLSPSLYWQYLTAAALLAQPPNSAAMVNAARAYHYCQQYLNPSMVSDWLEDRTPSLASSAASEESVKESPNIERADLVSEAGDVQMEESDLLPAAADGDAVADKADGAAGGADVAVAVGGRVGRKRAHAVEMDDDQDEASSRRKYK